MANIAQHVISKCGGAHFVANLLGLKPLEVYRWTYPRERGGRDGFVPARYQVRLLTLARGRGIDLRTDDFFGLDGLPPLMPAANDNPPSPAMSKLTRHRRASNSNQHSEKEGGAA
ncbi:hypothetical protein [Dongia sp.]|uniref:hypothetical protein n=1 Tax=Dongia sp. TaxID=1977262 RepID=UPI0035B0F073